MLVVPGETITADALPPAIRGARATSIRVPLGMRMDDIERQVLRFYLDGHSTIKEAALALGISLRTMHDKIRRYGLRARQK